MTKNYLVLIENTAQPKAIEALHGINGKTFSIRVSQLDDDAMTAIVKYCYKEALFEKFGHELDIEFKMIVLPINDFISKINNGQNITDGMLMAQVTCDATLLPEDKIQKFKNKEKH